LSFGWLSALILSAKRSFYQSPGFSKRKIEQKELDSFFPLLYTSVFESALSHGADFKLIIYY